MALLILFQDSILSITLPVYFHSFCISVYPSHFIEKKKKKGSHTFFILLKTDTLQKHWTKSIQIVMLSMSWKSLIGFLTSLTSKGYSIERFTEESNLQSLREDGNLLPRQKSSMSMQGGRKNQSERCCRLPSPEACANPKQHTPGTLHPLPDSQRISGGD